MKKEGISELEGIKKAALALEEGLYSKDPATVAHAEAQLKLVASKLQAWAKKYKVTLTQRVEEHPKEARRRRKCQGILDVKINGKSKSCLLIGRDGRNCLYNCFDATVDPF